MKKAKVSLSTLELTNASILIKSIEEDLIKKKEDYRINFIKQTYLLYPILKENGKMSEHWNRQMYYCIGTGEEEISYELKSEIALVKSPIYLELLCHTMVGCLVLQRKITCNVGHDEEGIADILNIIKKTANEIGLEVEFSTKEKEGFNSNLYNAKYATFFLKV